MTTDLKSKPMVLAAALIAGVVVAAVMLRPNPKPDADGATPQPQAQPDAAADGQPSGAAPAVPGATGVPGARGDEVTTEYRLGLQAAPAKREGALRLATYNVENLFDAKDDPALSGEEEDLDDTKPETELRALAEVIRRLDADVLALQEVESLEALKEFRDTYLSDMKYDYIVSMDSGAERGIENSLMSRHPIIDSQIWRDLTLDGVHPDLFNGQPNRYAGEPLEMRRSPLRATIEVLRPGARPGNLPGSGGYRVTLFVVHHKSGRGNEYWREAEAAKVLELVRAVEKTDKNANVAIVGDFNALEIDDSVKTYTRNGLFDLMAGKDRRDPLALTHESDRRIDFIVVNGNLKAELIPGSEFVLGAPLRPEGADWRTTPKAPGHASDHLPVAVDLIPKEN